MKKKSAGQLCANKNNASLPPLKLATGGDPLQSRLQDKLASGTLTVRGADMLSNIQARNQSNDTQRYGIDTQAGTSRYGTDAQSATARMNDLTQRYGVDTQAGTARYGVDAQSATARMNDATQRYGVDTQAGTSRYGTDASVYNNYQNNQTSRYNADNQNATQLGVTGMNNATSMYNADNNNATQRYSTDASVYNNSMNNDTSRYNNDQNNQTTQRGQNISAQSNRYNTDASHDTNRFYGGPQAGPRYGGGYSINPVGNSYGNYGNYSNNFLYNNRYGMKDGGEAPWSAIKINPGVSVEGNPIRTPEAAPFYPDGESMADKMAMNQRDAASAKTRMATSDGMADKMRKDQIEKNSAGLRGEFSMPSFQGAGFKSSAMLQSGGEVSPYSVKGIGRAMGFFQTPEEKRNAAVAKIDAEQEAYKQKQAAKLAEQEMATTPKAGVSGYVANDALDKRMKEAGMADGGELRDGNHFVDENGFVRKNTREDFHEYHRDDIQKAIKNGIQPKQQMYQLDDDSVLDGTEKMVLDKDGYSTDPEHQMRKRGYQMEAMGKSLMADGGELHAQTGFFGNLRKAMLPTDAEKAAKEKYLKDTQYLTEAKAPAVSESEVKAYHTKKIQEEGGNWGRIDPPTTAASTPEKNKNRSSGVSFQTARALKEMGMINGGQPRMPQGTGGVVPGKGTGDKIPAKYEPGEFVVSNDMLDADPALRVYLRKLRKQVLAEKGMTPQQADAKALMGTVIKAEDSLVTPNPEGETNDLEKKYLIALEAQKAATPSYFSQKTPTSEQRLIDATAAADAALQATYRNKKTPETSSTPTPAAATTPQHPTPNAATALSTTSVEKAYADPSRKLDVNYGATNPAASTTQPVTVKGPDGRDYINEAVSQDDRDESERLLNSVRGQWGADSPNKEARAAALDTVNQAWAKRGSGIKAEMDPRGNGQLVLSNSNAVTKMAYVDTEGNPTTDYKKTSQYAQGVEVSDRMAKYADKVESERKAEQAELERQRIVNSVMNAGPHPSEIDKAKWELSIATNQFKSNPDKIKAAQSVLDSLLDEKSAANAARANLAGVTIGAQNQMAQTNVTKKHNDDSNNLAQQQFGFTKLEFGMKVKDKAALDAARRAYAIAKTPEEKAAAKAVLESLGVKFGDDGKNRYRLHETKTVIGPDGNPIPGRLVMVDTDTGQEREVGVGGGPTGIAQPASQSEYDKLPKGAKYTKGDGQTYTKG